MSAANTVEIEVWVLVDEAGDYAVGVDQDTAGESYKENIDGSGCQRYVKVALTVPLPAPVTLTGVVPEETTEGATLVAS